MLKKSINASSTTYDSGLPLWKNHLLNISETPAVPPLACQIHTPLNLQSWQYHLSRHPNQQLVKYFLEGISSGFRIGPTMETLRPAQKYLQGALLHPQVVDEYLQAELSLHRISGPFPQTSCPAIQIS